MNERIEIRPGRTVDILSLGNPQSDITIFFFHGLGGRKAQWQSVIHLLKDNYRIIALDMLGHGESDKPQSKQINLYSFQELDRDNKAIFNRYASKHNIIAGHSYGGAFATSLGLAHPEMITKLLLISPVPLSPETKIPFLFTLPTRVMELIRPLLERQMAKLIFDPKANPKLVEEEIVTSRQNPMHVIKSMIKGLLSIPRTDVSNLAIPTWIVIGEHDRLIPPITSLSFYETLPNHHIVTLKDVGHMAIMETPEKVASLI